MKNNLDIPSWFSYPEIIEELRKNYKHPSQGGFAIFFTGLSGAGKSTLARILGERLKEFQNRNVVTLDGDYIRKNISLGLGFSKKDRSINVRRVGFISDLIVSSGGIVLCSLISPYKSDRDHNRELITQHTGKKGYIEVYVSTPLSICEKRDVKGLYIKARKGIIKNFTGIDDSYEPPLNPELVIDTKEISPFQAVDRILSYLTQNGYIENRVPFQKGS